MKEENKGYVLAEKAYRIDLYKIAGDFWQYGEFWCYAKNRNTAKSKLLDKARDEEMLLKHSEDEVTYVNIPIERFSDYDTYHFGGKKLTMHQISEQIRESDRQKELDNILNDKSISHCYIRKGSYYRPNSCGYTDFQSRAGIYTKEEAVKSARLCRDLSIIPINVQEHNGMIRAEIEDLESRIIQHQQS